MNAYYSNLIEGNDTRPGDIARAIAAQLDVDETRRNLALEAAALVDVQTKIDRLAAQEERPEPASLDFIRWVHTQCYSELPEKRCYTCVQTTRITL